MSSPQRLGQRCLRRAGESGDFLGHSGDERVPLAFGHALNGSRDGDRHVRGLPDRQGDGDAGDAGLALADLLRPALFVEPGEVLPDGPLQLLQTCRGFAVQAGVGEEPRQFGLAVGADADEGAPEARAHGRRLPPDLGDDADRAIGLHLVEVDDVLPCEGAEVDEFVETEAHRRQCGVQGLDDALGRGLVVGDGADPLAQAVVPGGLVLLDPVVFAEGGEGVVDRRLVDAELLGDRGQGDAVGRVDGEELQDPQRTGHARQRFVGTHAAILWAVRILWAIRVRFRSSLA